MFQGNIVYFDEEDMIVGVGSWVIYFKIGCKFYYKVLFYLYVGSRGREKEVGLLLF